MGERILKIAITSIFLVLVFFLFQGIFKACNNASSTNTQKTDKANAALESEDTTLEEYSSEYFEDGVTSENDEEYTTYGASDSEEFNDDLFDEPEEEKTAPAETTYREPKPQPKSAPVASSNTTGKYIAVAGNYLIIDNARNMVQKLQRIGYDDAEYFTFDGSEYYTVGAIRSNDYDSVQSSARDLRQRGIDNYIHTVR